MPLGLAIAIAAGAILAAVVTYDARGRVWHGWSDAGFWGVLTFFLGLLALPFYLLARARTTKRVPQPATPAGWYADPRSQRMLRYWDGSEWTDQTADRPRPA